MIDQPDVVDATTQNDMDDEEEKILQRAIQASSSSQNGVWDHIVSTWRGGGFCAPTEDDDDSVKDEQTRAVVSSSSSSVPPPPSSPEKEEEDVDHNNHPQTTNHLLPPLEAITETFVLEEEDDFSSCDNTPPLVEMQTLPVPSSQPSRCLLWLFQALLVCGLVIGVTLGCIVQQMSILQPQSPPAASSFHFSLQPKQEGPIFVLEPSFQLLSSRQQHSSSYASLLVIDTILEGMNFDSNQIVDWLETNVPFGSFQ